MRGTILAARLGAAAAIICSTLCTAHAETQVPLKPPVEAFAVLPPEQPQISPDGSRFTLIRGINGRPAVAIYKVDAPQELPQIITSSDWLLAGMRWVKNDALILYDRKNMKMGVYDRNNDILRPIHDAAAVLLKENKFVSLSRQSRNQTG